MSIIYKSQHNYCHNFRNTWALKEAFYATLAVAYQVLIFLLEKSNMKHKTTKSAHKMSNQMKQIAKRQILAFLCEPIRKPSAQTRADPCTFNTARDGICFNSHSDLIISRGKRSLKLNPEWVWFSQVGQRTMLLKKGVLWSEYFNEIQFHSPSLLSWK